LRKSKRKNILLFIGDKESTLHKSAASAFENACGKMGLNLLDTLEFGDSEDELSKVTAEAFRKYGGAVDGIYTTSGISESLCKYLDENKIDAAFVAFDTHETVRKYIKKGVVCAAIDQNVTHQMACAFESLVKHIISGEKCEKVIYTDVQLVLNSNIYQFD
jgi:ABC-type sugar transport system substrate-binding protein